MARRTSLGRGGGGGRPPASLRLALSVVNTATPVPLSAEALRAAIRDATPTPGLRLLFAEVPRAVLADLVLDGVVPGWAEMARAAEAAARADPAAGGRDGATLAWVRDMVRLELAAPAGDRRPAA